MREQQITTAAELDALPVGSVGSGAEGQTYARYAGGWFGAGRLHPLDTSTEVSFPVVVLYRPDSPVVQPAGDGATDEREALLRMQTTMLFPGSDYPVAAIPVTHALSWFAARRQGAPMITAEQVEAAARRVMAEVQCEETIDRLCDEHWVEWDQTADVCGWALRIARAALGVQP